MFVLKRTGEIVEFNHEKIASAISRALKSSHEEVSKPFESVTPTELASKIEHSILQSEDITIPINIETIQNYVEIALMEAGFFVTARSYIIYRHEHSKSREQIVDKSISELVHQNSQYFDDDLVRQFVYYRTYGTFAFSYHH